VTKLTYSQVLFYVFIDKFLSQIKYLFEINKLFHRSLREDGGTSD